MKKTYPIFLLFTILAWFYSCKGSTDAERSKIDSLNALAYKTKYSSPRAAMVYVDKIMANHSDTEYDDGLYEATLNRGDIHGMAMDYDSAQLCYETVLSESGNDLICSMADVDMMSVCLMTSQSKEFYDYRSEAKERFSNIAEACNDMSEHQRLLWNAVQTEYHFVSFNYFMNIRQDEGMAEEMKWLDDNQALFAADTIQQATYLLLKAAHVTGGAHFEADAEEAQRSLVRLLSSSHRYGYKYFEVLALNGLAYTLQNGGTLRPSLRVLVEELTDYEGEEDLAYRLAKRALSLSKEYGNAYVETSVLLTLSDYYLANGQDSLSLDLMKRAISLVNIHHKRMDRMRTYDEADTLLVYSKHEDALSTEMRWIADTSVPTVPEWMAMVREQLSIVYGAIGMKAESDYNHNIFFDVLDATRQDQRAQQEQDNLNREKRTLNTLLCIFCVMFIVLAVALIVYNKRSNLEYKKKVEILSRVIDLCHSMSSAITDEVKDEESLVQALHIVSDTNVKSLFPQLGDEDWTQIDTNLLSGLDKEMFNVLRVFFLWMREKGMEYIKFVNEKKKLESETYMFGKRLEGYKQQYIEKLTSVSIVNGITPFLDRALHEVNKLKNEQHMSQEKARERLLYLSELVNKINEYNEVLGHWVKIRQGMVALNIETFDLQPLLDTIKHSAKSFDTKNVKLIVKDSSCTVKADKALTLFMMNTLLDNARKYTPSGGEVELSADETDNFIEVSVKDTGYGMSAEDIDIINKTKVYDSSKIGSKNQFSGDINKNKGFGFGLMNCKGIINKYKKTSHLFNVCDFRVKSRTGGGCCFIFRLPKGVKKTALCLYMLLMCGSALADSMEPLDGKPSSANLSAAAAYADKVFTSNVAGDHAMAVAFADSAIAFLNAHYMERNPDGDQLMELEGIQMAELKWWKDKIQTDYELIISIRNEVSIAALAMNRNSLYHYNNEVFTRLYRLTSTDPTMEEYCKRINRANRNRKTSVILLGTLILAVLITYFFLHYRHYQLFIFNLRQFIQLNNKVFSSTGQQLTKLLQQSLSDIKSVDAVGLMIQSGNNPGQCAYSFSGEVSERSTYEAIMRSAYNQRKDVYSQNGHFRAYPLVLPGSNGTLLTGVMGIRYSDNHLTAEEELIVNLVTQFMSIHSYFSCLKVDEMDELIEEKQEERQRIDNEQQRVYVQNQILDNCLSTLKHETMYYPNRIKQIVDEALSSKELPAGSTFSADGIVKDNIIDDIDELLSYYKEIFTVLSACASKQVDMKLFKRIRLSSDDIGTMASRTFSKLGRKTHSQGSFKLTKHKPLYVMGDKVFVQTLIENVLSLFFEHNSGGDLLFDFEESDGFAKFAFTDTRYKYDDATIPQLFYVDNLSYDASSDMLIGAQYLLCRQIIREHDAFSSRRGCRIYVENTAASGSTFVFTLPSSN